MGLNNSKSRFKSYALHTLKVVTPRHDARNKKHHLVRLELRGVRESSAIKIAERITLVEIREVDLNSLTVCVHFKEDFTGSKEKKVRVFCDHQVNFALFEKVGKLRIGLVRRDNVLYLEIFDVVNELLDDVCRDLDGFDKLSVSSNDVSLTKKLLGFLACLSSDLLSLFLNSTFHA